MRLKSCKHPNRQSTMYLISCSLPLPEQSHLSARSPPWSVRDVRPEQASPTCPQTSPSRLWKTGKQIRDIRKNTNSVEKSNARSKADIDQNKEWSHKQFLHCTIAWKSYAETPNNIRTLKIVQTIFEITEKMLNAEIFYPNSPVMIFKSP